MVYEYTTAKRRMIFSMDVSSAFILNSICECEQQKRRLKRLETKLTNTFFWRTFCSCSSGIQVEKKKTKFLYMHCALAACVVSVPSWWMLLLSCRPKLHNFFYRMHKLYMQFYEKEEWKKWPTVTSVFIKW